MQLRHRLVPMRDVNPARGLGKSSPGWRLQPRCHAPRGGPSARLAGWLVPLDPETLPDMVGTERVFGCDVHHIPMLVT